MFEGVTPPVKYRQNCSEARAEFSAASHSKLSMKSIFWSPRGVADPRISAGDSLLQTCPASYLIYFGICVQAGLLPPNLDKLSAYGDGRVMVGVALSNCQFRLLSS